MDSSAGGIMMISLGNVEREASSAGWGCALSFNTLSGAIDLVASAAGRQWYRSAEQGKRATFQDASSNLMAFLLLKMMDGQIGQAQRTSSSLTELARSTHVCVTRWCQNVHVGLPSKYSTFRY